MKRKDYDVITTENTEKILNKIVGYLNKKENHNFENTVQSFVSSRITDIKNAETPVELKSEGNVILHLIPFSSFKSIEQIIDLDLIQKHSHLLSPLGTNHNDSKYNYEGHLTYNDYGYTQTFRNGCIETVSNRLYTHNNEHNNKIIFGLRFENAIIKQLANYINVLKEQKFEDSFYVFITLTKTKGLFMLKSPGYPILDRDSIDTNEISLPKTRIENSENIKPFMKHPFDILWNAGGKPGSPNY